MRLVDLLDEAKDRVTKILDDRVNAGQTYIDRTEIEEASKAIGYGAVKYADLSSNRQKDYRFDYDAMLNLTGDTLYTCFTHMHVLYLSSANQDKIRASLFCPAKENVVCPRKKMQSGILSSSYSNFHK